MRSRSGCSGSWGRRGRPWLILICCILFGSLLATHLLSFKVVIFGIKVDASKGRGDRDLSIPAAKVNPNLPHINFLITTKSQQLAELEDLPVMKDLRASIIEVRESISREEITNAKNISVHLPELGLQASGLQQTELRINRNLPIDINKTLIVVGTSEVCGGPNMISRRRKNRMNNKLHRNETNGTNFGRFERHFRNNLLKSGPQLDLDVGPNKTLSEREQDALKWQIESKNASALPSLSSSLKSPVSNRSLLLILVHSARNHLEERDAIRNTYGTISSYKEWDIKIVFLLGKGQPNRNLRSPRDEEDSNYLYIRLAWEMEANNDMVIGSFVDAYRNLTYKHVLGFRYAVQYCPQAKYVVKVDDDTFVDTFEIIDHAIPLMVKKNGTFLCSRRAYMRPIRDKDDLTQGSWLVTEEEYPGDKYPTYCAGSGYVVSWRGIRYLFPMIEKVPFLWLDDVYATGVLRKAYEDSHPKNKLSIVHKEHVDRVEQYCSYTAKNRLGAYRDGRRPSFHKMDHHKVVDDAWCLWEGVLMQVNLMKSQVYRYVLSVKTA